MRCIICKSEINGLHESTQHGPVHVGHCSAHYQEIQESLNEDTSVDIDQVLTETVLL